MPMVARYYKYGMPSFAFFCVHRTDLKADERISVLNESDSHPTNSAFKEHLQGHFQDIGGEYIPCSPSATAGVDFVLCNSTKMFPEADLESHFDLEHGIWRVRGLAEEGPKPKEFDSWQDKGLMRMRRQQLLLPVCIG